jgi:glycosyltransferase involved in cell wall biosynthesis
MATYHRLLSFKIPDQTAVEVLTQQRQTVKSPISNVLFNLIKVLHLIKSLGRGGAEMLLPETLRAHDRQNFDFAYGYFVYYKSQVVPDIEVQGAKVHCFKANRGDQILLKAPAVARFAKNWGADLIHCHLPLAGIAGRMAGKMAGIPVVYTEHNKQERYHFLTRFANARTIGWNDVVLSVSADVESSLRQATSGKKVRIQTLLNGVDTRKFDRKNFDRQAARAQLGIPEDALVMGTVAVFRFQKRLHLWVEMAKKISLRFPNAWFVLVGDGQHFEDIKKQVTALGLSDRTLFPGRLEEVRPWLSAMDIYLMTSEFEGLPIAMLEAMSMELPVVATAAGGIGEVIRDGKDGFLAPVAEHEQLLQPLTQLLENESLRHEIGAVARRRAQDAFSIERMTRELEQVYRDVLKNKPHR